MKHKKSDQFETKSLSSSLVKFSVDYNPALTSKELSQSAKLSLFDWFVVSIAGQGEPVSQIVRGLIETEHSAKTVVCLGANIITQRGPLLLQTEPLVMLWTMMIHILLIWDTRVSLYYLQCSPLEKKLNLRPKDF